MYVAARSRNHCRSGKVKSIIYSECLFIALGMQNAMRLRHIFIFGLSRSALFGHIITQTARYSRKGNKYYIFWVCVYNLRYLEYNENTPYFHLWPVPLCIIYPHYHTNGTIFDGKNVIKHKMCVLIFCTTFCLKHFSFWEKLNEMSSKIFIVLHFKCPSFLSSFNETWITVFRKVHKYQISWQNLQWEPSCSMWTDRHDEVNIRLSHLA